MAGQPTPPSPHVSQQYEMPTAPPPSAPASPPPQNDYFPYDYESLYARPRPHPPTYYQDNTSPQLYPRMTAPPAYTRPYNSPPSSHPHSHDPASPSNGASQDAEKRSYTPSYGSAPYNPAVRQNEAPFHMPHQHPGPPSDASGQVAHAYVGHPMAPQYPSHRPQQMNYENLYAPPQGSNSDFGPPPPPVPPPLSPPVSPPLQSPYAGHVQPMGTVNLTNSGAAPHQSQQTLVHSHSPQPGVIPMASQAQSKESDDGNVGLYVCLGLVMGLVINLLSFLLLCCSNCLGMRGGRKAGFLVGAAIGVLLNVGTAAGLYFYVFDEFNTTSYVTRSASLWVSA